MPKRRNRQRQRVGRSRRSIPSSNPRTSIIAPTLRLRTRFAQSLIVSSDSSGNISQVVQGNPLVTAISGGFPEFKNLALPLYSQIRLVEFGCQLTPAIDFDSKTSTSGSLLAIGSLLFATNFLTVNPTPTVDNILSLWNGRLYAVDRDTTSRGTIMKIVPPRPLLYADISQPAQESFAGTCSSAVLIVGSGFPVSSPVLSLMIFGVYDLMGRQ